MNSLRWVLAVNITPAIQNPWYIVTLVCFTTGNRPDAVPLLFKYVLGEVERAQNQFKVPEVEAKRERLLLSRKFRDAIFKCGVVGGYSKVHPLLSRTNHCCNKLPPGNKRLGLSSRGYARGTTRHGTTKVSDKANARGLCDGFRRETGISLPELERRGEGFFRDFYGETADGVQDLLDKIYPDMGTHIMPFKYPNSGF
jgi:hypothetical protein